MDDSVSDRVVILGYFSRGLYTGEFSSGGRALPSIQLPATVFCGFLREDDDTLVQISLELNEHGSAVAIMSVVEEYDKEMSSLARELVHFLEDTEDGDFSNYRPEHDMKAMTLHQEIQEWDCPFFSVSDSRWGAGGQPFTISDLFIHRLDIEDYDADDDEEEEDEDEDEDEEEDEDEDEDEEEEEEDS